MFFVVLSGIVLTSRWSCLVPYLVWFCLVLSCYLVLPRLASSCLAFFVFVCFCLVICLPCLGLFFSMPYLELSLSLHTLSGLWAWILKSRTTRSLHLRLALQALNSWSLLLLSCLVCCCLCCLVLFCLVLFCLALPCLVLPCLVLSCLALSCLALPCLVLSCLALPCLVLSCLDLFCLALPCLVLSGRVLSCLVLSCLILSCLCCLVLSCLVLSCLRCLSCLLRAELKSIYARTLP